LCFAQLIPLSSWRGYGHPEIDALVQRVSRLAHDLGDAETVARALGMAVFLHLIHGRCTAARDAARELAALAEATGLVVVLVNAHMQAQISCHHLGHFADADVHAAQVARIGPILSPAERFMNLYDPVVASLAESSRNAWITGRLATAVALAEQGVALGGEIGNAESLAFSWLFHAWLHGYRGDWRTCLQSSATGIAVAARNGTVQTLAWNRCVHGWARAHQGDLAGGWQELAEGTSLSQSITGDIALPQFRAMMAEVLVLAGDLDEARGCLTQALTARDTQDDDYFAAEVHRLAACCDAPGPHGYTREAHLEAAFTIARRQGATFFALRAALTSRLLFGGDSASVAAALAAISESEPWADITAARALV
jgi:predicted ATPase